MSSTSPTIGSPTTTTTRALPSHITIKLCSRTLRFDSPELERRFQLYTQSRLRRLLLRSLFPAIIFQIVLFACDYVEFPQERLTVTVPARLVLATLQLSTFALVYLNILPPTELVVLSVSIAYGAGTLALYILQREFLRTWDTLFFIWGMAFYTVPKISPLSFIHSLYGSWASFACYFTVTMFLHRPSSLSGGRLAISAAIAIPTLLMFNMAMYYSEYAARERFVLRDRLNQEHISVAVSRTTHDVDGRTKRNAVLFGMLVWCVLTLAGYSSIHDFLIAPFHSVTSPVGWAWFTHIAGLSAFLVRVTHQIRWIFVSLLFGYGGLWLMTHTVPENWIIFSAHSIGYTLLLTAGLIALYAVGEFVNVWQQVIRYLRGLYLLYPQLRDSLRRDYPLLERIVRNDYLDEEVFQRQETIAKEAKALLTSTTTPQRPSNKASNRGLIESTKSPTHPPNEDTASSPREIGTDLKLSSILSSPKSGCFFCNKEPIVHLVPVCESWGRYATWRADIAEDVERAKCGGKIAIPRTAPATLCTPFGDLAIRAATNERALRRANEELRRIESVSEAKVLAAEHALQEMRETVTNLHNELERVRQTHANELLSLDRLLNQRIDQLNQDNNRVLHDSRVALRGALHRAEMAEQALAELNQAAVGPAAGHGSGAGPGGAATQS